MIFSFLPVLYHVSTLASIMDCVFFAFRFYLQMLVFCLFPSTFAVPNIVSFIGLKNVYFLFSTTFVVIKTS